MEKMVKKLSDILNLLVEFLNLGSRETEGTLLPFCFFCRYDYTLCKGTCIVMCVFVYTCVWVCERAIEVCTCGNYPKSVSPFQWHMHRKEFLWLQGL